MSELISVEQFSVFCCMEYFSRLQKCWPEDGQAPASLPIAGERWKSYPIRSTGSHLFNESNSTFNTSGAPTYVGPMPELKSSQKNCLLDTFDDSQVFSLTEKFPPWLQSTFGYFHDSTEMYSPLNKCLPVQMKITYFALNLSRDIHLFWCTSTHEVYENEPLGYS